MNRVLGSTQYLKRIKSIIESKNSWGKNELISMLHHEHLEYIESLDKADDNMNDSIFPDLEINKSDEMGESNYTLDTTTYTDDELDDLPF